MAQITRRNHRPLYGMVMEPLKPCPFCGSEAILEEVEAGIGRTDAVSFTVGCNSKEEESCMGYQSLQTFAMRGDAVKAWNKRA